MATIVDPVPYKDVTADTTFVSDTIDEISAEADIKANELMAQFAAAIQNLTSTEPFSVDFDDLEKDISELILSAFPEAPDIQVLLNTAWPDGYIPDPNYVDIKVDTSFDKPVAPASLDPVFDFVQKMYHSDVYAPLVNALLSDLINGGTGFSESAYQAVLDRESKARARINDRRRVAEDRILGAGSMMPSGFSADVKLNTEADFAREDSIALAGVVVKDFEITDSNTRFTKEQLQGIETMLRADFQAGEGLRFEIAKGTKEVALSIFSENIKRYIADWEGVKAQLEGAKIEAEIGISKNEEETKRFLGQAQVLESKIKAISAENESRTGVAQAEASIYSAQVAAISTEQSALIERVRVQKDLYLADLQVLVEKNKLGLDAYSSAENINAEKMVSIAQVTAQTLAAVWAQVHASVSMGASRSKSEGYSTSVSNGLSEGYTTNLTTVP